MRALPHPRRRRVSAMLRRPALAGLAVLVWLLGVELGPGLHIARHAQHGHHHHAREEALVCALHDAAQPHGAAHGHQAPAGHDGHHAAAPEHHDTPATHEEHHAATLEHHAPVAHEYHGAADYAVTPEHPAAREHDAATGHAAADELPPTVDHHVDDAVAGIFEHHGAHVEPSALALAERAPATHEHTAAPDHGSVPHGAGSLAHRDLVPLTPPLVLPPILSAPWQPLVVVSILRIAPRERTPRALRARGPPHGGLVREPPRLV